MAWTLATQLETGDPQDSGIMMPFEAMPFNRQDYPVLSLITPYYDTIFNPDQLAIFISEWDKALLDPEHADSLRKWGSVRELAAKCISEQRYLRFIGD